MMGNNEEKEKPGARRLGLTHSPVLSEKGSAQVGKSDAPERTSKLCLVFLPPFFFSSSTTLLSQTSKQFFYYKL